MHWIPPTPTWSLVELRPGVEVAPDLIGLAVDATEAKRDTSARTFLRALDWTAFESYWTEAGLEGERRHDKTLHKKKERPASRGPAVPKATKLVVAQRDGWRCRYCGLRVISGRVLKALQVRYPAFLPLGNRAVDDHPAHRVLRCTQDHLVAQAAGGMNDPDNLVTSCAVAPATFRRATAALTSSAFARRSLASLHWMDGAA